MDRSKVTDGPVSLVDILANGQAEKRRRTLTAILVQHLGHGEKRMIREKFYSRIILRATRDPAVHDLVVEVLSDARGAANPGRYFCRALKLRLREHDCREIANGIDRALSEGGDQ